MLDRNSLTSANYFRSSPHIFIPHIHVFSHLHFDFLHPSLDEIFYLALLLAVYKSTRMPVLTLHKTLLVN